MKVALAQTNIIWEKKHINISIAEQLIEKASNMRVPMILFPEMSFTGFTMNIEYSAEDNCETLNQMIGYASKYKIAIGFGWVKRNEDKAENHYTVVDCNGKVLSDYIKIHPFSFGKENQKFIGGTKIYTFKFEDRVFSSFICYDLRFPEVFRIASRTANYIIVAANWPKSRCIHWKTLLRSRAIENQVYIVAVNCIGKNIGGVEYRGDSCVINPNGDFLDEEVCNELLIFDIIDDVAVFRENFPVRKDIKEKLYFEMKEEEYIAL